MYQIDNSTAAAVQPASTSAGSAGFFTDGNPAGGTAATIVPAEWLNAVMMELCNAITSAGLTLSKSTFNQLSTAIRAIGRSPAILNDTGAVNAYASANSPALVVGTWVDGVVQRVKIANTNTGASTYSPDGLTAIPIYGLGLAALQGSELKVGGVAAMMRMTIAGVNGGNPICVLLDCFGGAQQIAPATAGNHAAQLAQVGFRNQAIYRRIGGVQQVSINGGAFTTSGATSFPAPTGGMAKYRIWAGGGGGGGSTGGAGALGGGGGGGGYVEGVVTGLSSATAITVGAGGAGGTTAPTAGSQGGTSSFGAVASAFGGSGGQAQTGVGGATPGGGSGGSGGVLIIPGTAGGSGYSLGSGAVSGAGGGAFGTTSFQGPVSTGSSGFSGIFPAGGATGTNNANATAGADGLVIVEY